MGHVAAGFSQTNFRFRNDDGSETSATWQAAQNTNITPDVQSDFPTRLRVMVQETNGGAVNNADITLQYQVNGGTWTNVDGSSTNIDFRTSPNVSNGTATTSQLTGGTGDFVTGTFISADASAASISFAANEHTELEYSLVAIAADLADSDVINFRVLVDGAEITYSETPTLTVDNVNYPTVTSSAADQITSNSARLNGSTTDDGDNSITERGFVWGTSADPTTSDNKVVVSGVSGTMQETISSLSEETEYHFRAYATNVDGTTYSTNRSFTTLANQSPTVSQNSPADTATITDTTPTFTFTGTDDEGEAITYQIQIDTVDTFDSQEVV